MESLSFEGGNIIKDIRNIFRLDKETKAIKDKTLKDIKNLFDHEEEENYQKPVRVISFWSNNDIEYKSNSDNYRLKNILIELDYI